MTATETLRADIDEIMPGVVADRRHARVDAGADLRHRRAGLGVDRVLHGEPLGGCPRACPA